MSSKTVHLFVILSVSMFASINARASESDALAISSNIQARHFPYGAILDPVYAAPTSDQIVAYTHCGDSAIWTGHYLAAEAFRYNVTRSSDALDNVKKAIAGIMALVNVTGTDVLARCMVPTNSPYLASIQGEESHNGIYTVGSLVWVGNTSRDQYCGVMFGLSVAFDMVDDPGVKSSITTLTTRLLDFLEGHIWTIVMPDGSISTTFALRPEEILALLQIGKQVNPTRYSTDYATQRDRLSFSVLATAGVDVLSDDSYFKFNLDYGSFYNLIRLETGSAKSTYSTAYGIVRNYTAGHQNAFFNVIDRALNGANDAPRDSDTLTFLNEWLLRPRRDPFVDLSGTVPVCGSKACQPVPVQLRPSTDFLWQRVPFQLAGGGVGTTETAGIDYILPYWMGRYYGVITGGSAAFVVQSAAAASTSVSAGSIASLYGTNLAAQTVQASAQPLPTSLGGISVFVKDSAGTERPATLIFVSPSQINLVVPDGTALGPATFTIRGGAAALVATGMIQNVSPTLFSASGNGTGVAAATAIRTQAANPQLQSPVTVFQCDTSHCFSVPINLGVDTPVYLTLYATGVRNRSSQANVSVTINGTSVQVLYAGAQGSFAGLDQINVPLTLNLRGSGESNVVLTVDGQKSNTVTGNIQ